MIGRPRTAAAVEVSTETVPLISFELRKMPSGSVSCGYRGDAVQAWLLYMVLVLVCGSAAASSNESVLPLARQEDRISGPKSFDIKKDVRFAPLLWSSSAACW